MVITKLMGGLGNQMFQYAIGRALSLKYEVPLLVDTRFFNYKNDDQSTRRNLELDLFNTHFKIARQEDLDLFENKTILIRVMEKKLSIPAKYKVIDEPGHEFHPQILNAGKNVYLNGYWQSEKYFSAIRVELLKDFVPKASINEINKTLSKKVSECNSVSVHIRRGDYVTNTSNLSYHGVCSPEYYYNAIAKIREISGNELALFVFTDDAEWVAKEFKPEQKFEIINVNHGSESYWDMYLMSLCSHNIVANSSFSWWGAWLNMSENKIVAAPKEWFASKDINTKDVIPQSWIKL